MQTDVAIEYRLQVDVAIEDRLQFHLAIDYRFHAIISFCRCDLWPESCCQIQAKSLCRPNLSSLLLRLRVRVRRKKSSRCSWPLLLRLVVIAVPLLVASSSVHPLACVWAVSLAPPSLLMQWPIGIWRRASILPLHSQLMRCTFLTSKICKFLLTDDPPLLLHWAY